jgi:glycosyltransferase involved in cell wall biosynthesis
MSNGRILFDGLATQSESGGGTLFHGGGEYAKYVFRKAIEAGYRNFDIVFSNKMIIDENIKNLAANTGGISVYYVDNIKEVYALLANGNYDCFFSALAVLHENYDLDIPFIMVVHGLRPVELPWDAYRGNYTKNVILRAIFSIISRSMALQNMKKRKHIRSFKRLFEVKNKKIITVSEYSKYSMLYNFPHLDINCISTWYSPNYELGKIEENSDCVNNEYFLMISANRWEKNIARAVEAFDALFSRRQLKDKYALITGCTESCRFLKKIKNKDKFKLLPYIKETELEDMYRRSFAFVFPSLNEGFGIPPLRAMKYGVPVIASSSTSIPEVCGDAAYYFNPCSVEDMTNRILQLTYDSGLYKRLVENGYRRYQRYQRYQQYQQYQQIREIFEQGYMGKTK